jgi:hypothetical protein
MSSDTSDAESRRTGPETTGARLDGVAAVMGGLLFAGAIVLRSVTSPLDFAGGEAAFEFRRAVFSIGDGELVVALGLLLVGLAGLVRRERRIEGRLWLLGVASTAAGFGLGLLAAVGRVVFGPTAGIGLLFAAGTLAYIAGSLPLGAALALSERISDLLRLAGLVFASAGPSLSLGVTLFGTSDLLAGVLIAAPYGLAWVLVGGFLLTDLGER